MTVASIPLAEDYWNSLSINKNDIEYINNYLFENELPLSAKDLVPLIIEERINQENLLNIKKQKDMGRIYLPAEKFNVGETLVFKQLDWKKGKVIEIRKGLNPNFGDFQVISVEFEGPVYHQFASGLLNHKLNQSQLETSTDSNTGVDSILSTYGSEIETKLMTALANEGGLVRIAGKWFTKALLIKISQGHLNLAEAILDEANGTPLSTASILDKVEISGNINKNLLEFSMNFALQEDTRFDEIGPAGEVLWCLERLEPENVRKVPEQLRYKPLEFDESVLTDQMKVLELELDDELSDMHYVETNLSESITISLTFPHWRAGTLPVSNRVKPLIPFAYESERIRFTLIDQKTNEEIPAWVVRKNKYIYGLKDFFNKNGLIPGSMITIRRSSNPGKVFIDAKIRRPTKEWVRTVLVGRDGGIVFAMLKQNITNSYNERMVIAVPDVENLDIAREKFAKSKTSFEDGVVMIMRDLTRLNLQGHIHAQELYSAVNVVMRCPPAPLLSLLSTGDKFTHVGDLHFRMEESI